MTLEVGMYVRTKNGYIRKIDRIWNDTNFNVDKVYYNENIYEDTLGCVLDEDIKGNPSFNIIDLMEVGDYVNGCFVLEKDSKFIVVNGLDNYGFGQGVIPIEDIKSIVTKEQFENMSYKVGE